MSDAEAGEPGETEEPGEAGETGEIGADDEPAPFVPTVAPRQAVSVAFAVTIATGAVITYAFDPARAGQASMLGAIGGLYVLLAAVALMRLHRRGELLRRFRPVSGDMTLGALTAGLLHGAGRIVQLVLAGHGSPREAWVVRLYLQIGDTDAAGHWVVGGAVFAVAALEEIVWRGLVMRTLEDALGAKKALLYSALLFALAHVPTAYLLRDPLAGLNPLVVVAALGCSLVWGALVLRTGRMVPALLAHAFFSWSVIEFPMWRA
jgi:membrane protease YdiL (CAAX protease family)